MRKTLCIWLLLGVADAAPGGTALTSTSAAGGVAGVRERGVPEDIDMAVVLDSAEQTGRASATVRIRARREIVWPLITTCPEALRMVPGLVKCEIVETAPDESWQIIRHVVDYSWFVRRLDYRIRARYERPSRVSIERISGDLQTLRAAWSLEADGEWTVARYSVDLAPGFWVPRWLVRSALKHDLPTMLHTLRDRAEVAARDR